MSSALIEALEKLKLENGSTFRLHVHKHRVLIQVIPDYDEQMVVEKLPQIDLPLIEEFEELDIPSPDWSKPGMGTRCSATIGSLSLLDPPLIEVEEQDA